MYDWITYTYSVNSMANSIVQWHPLNLLKILREHQKKIFHRLNQMNKQKFSSKSKKN